MAASSRPQLRLVHIRDEIDAVSLYVRDFDLQSYTQSYAAQRVVERALQIISEAVRALPRELLADYPDVDWVRIERIGNFLRHEYHQLDTVRLWKITMEELPPLRVVIEKMLSESPP